MENNNGDYKIVVFIQSSANSKWFTWNQTNEVAVYDKLRCIYSYNSFNLDYIQEPTIKDIEYALSELGYAGIVHAFIVCKDNEVNDVLETHRLAPSNADAWVKGEYWGQRLIQSKQTEVRNA